MDERDQLSGPRPGWAFPVEQQQRDTGKKKSEARVRGDPIGAEPVVEQNLIDPKVVAGRVADDRYETEEGDDRGTHPGREAAKFSVSLRARRLVHPQRGSGDDEPERRRRVRRNAPR